MSCETQIACNPRLESGQRWQTPKLTTRLRGTTGDTNSPGTSVNTD